MMCRPCLVVAGTLALTAGACSSDVRRSLPGDASDAGSGGSEPGASTSGRTEWGGESRPSEVVDGFDLTITKSGGDVQISWASQGVSSYEVWTSADPYFAPGDEASSIVQTSSAQSYTTAQGGESYYRVRAPGATETLSTTVGQIEYDLYRYYTKLGICLVSEVDTWPELAADIPSGPSSASMWDGPGQHWVVPPALDSVVFGPGEVISVFHNPAPSPNSYVAVGHVPSADEVSLPLYTGDNLVTTVPLRFGTVMASELLAEVDNATRIGRWDAATQTLYWHPNDGDWSIPPCSPIHVEVSAASSWPPPGAPQGLTECNDDECCTIGTQILGDSSDNSLTGTTSSECVVGFDGDDTLVGLDEDDELVGGMGDDTLDGGPGNDTVYPGMGADTTDGGAGADTVVVFDTCEIEAGEQLLRGAGTGDRLVLPVPLASLQAQFPSVTVSGFETIEVDPAHTCSAQCTLPCESTDPDFASLPDPTAWTVDSASGVRYRLATANERAQNGWLAGTWLIEDEDFVTDSQAGSVVVTAHFPDKQGALHEVAFLRSSSSSYISKVEREITSTSLVTAVTTPTVNTYLPDGFDPQDPGYVGEAWMDLLTTDDGEINAQGVFGENRIEVTGQNPGWTIDPISAPGGSIDPSSVVIAEYRWLGDYGELASSACNDPGGTALCDWLCLNTGVPCGPNDNLGPDLGECEDGFDNDGDGDIDSQDDHCNHNNVFSCDEYAPEYHRWESGESFAVFGDGQFCTKNAPKWFTEIHRQGLDTERLMNAVAQTGDEMRYLAGGCWIFSSVADAYDCTHNNACPAFAADYPYAGAGRSAGNYYRRVWDDVAHGADHGLYDALNAAVVLYFGGQYAGADSPDEIVQLDCVGEEGQGCCGASYAEYSCATRGAGVGQWNAGLAACAPNNSYVTIAHEIGHTMGLQHDAVYGTCPKDGEMGIFGFMGGNGFSGCGAALDSGNQATFNAALGDYNCPRPGGFDYDGVSSCGEYNCN